MGKYRVAYATGSRADYGIVKNFLRLLDNDKDIEFSVLVTGSHLEDKFGHSVDVYKRQGLYNVLTNYARGIDKVQYMVEMSLITTIASCVLNVVLLVVLKCGLNGYLIANYLGTFMAVAWGSVRLKIHKHIKFNKVNRTTVKAVSYTNLDVYKRQDRTLIWNTRKN